MSSNNTGGNRPGNRPGNPKITNAFAGLTRTLRRFSPGWQGGPAAQPPLRRLLGRGGARQAATGDRPADGEKVETPAAAEAGGQDGLVYGMLGANALASGYEAAPAALAAFTAAATPEWNTTGGAAAVKIHPLLEETRRGGPQLLAVAAGRRAGETDTAFRGTEKGFGAGLAPQEMNSLNRRPFTAAELRQIEQLLRAARDEQTSIFQGYVDF